MWPARSGHTFGQTGSESPWELSSGWVLHLNPHIKSSRQFSLAWGRLPPSPLKTQRNTNVWLRENFSTWQLSKTIVLKMCPVFWCCKTMYVLHSSHSRTTHQLPPKRCKKRAHNLSGKFTFIDVHGLLNLWTLGWCILWMHQIFQALEPAGFQTGPYTLSFHGSQAFGFRLEQSHFAQFPSSQPPFYGI